MVNIWVIYYIDNGDDIQLRKLCDYLDRNFACETDFRWIAFGSCHNYELQIECNTTETLIEIEKFFKRYELGDFKFDFDKFIKEQF